jgi:hypothetical protein
MHTFLGVLGVWSAMCVLLGAASALGRHFADVSPFARRWGR